MYNFRLYPLIVKPSRISDVNGTTIDTIFTNEVANDINSGRTHVSGHLLVFALCIYIDIYRTPKSVLNCARYESAKNRGI